MAEPHHIVERIPHEVVKFVIRGNCIDAKKAGILYECDETSSKEPMLHYGSTQRSVHGSDSGACFVIKIQNRSVNGFIIIAAARNMQLLSWRMKIPCSMY
jgi:hypothetical protein